MKLDKIIIGVLALIAILVLLLAGIGVCGFCLFANKITTTSFTSPVEHREDKTVHDGAANVSIEVDTIGGNIEISESTSDKIEVIYDVFATEGHLYDIVTGTNYSTEGDTLKIKATAKIPDYRSPMMGTRGAHVYVKVPKNASYSLNLNTAGGNVIVPDLRGESLRIATLGGYIELNGANYETITANTAGGDINAEYDAKKAVFDTLGGEIVLNAKQTNGTIKANTAGGDVRVTLPEGTLFTVDASTMGGRVTHGSIQMDATDETRTRLDGHTQNGAGNLDITLKTMGGNVEISY
jgi:DUF4097 and DUF4098 domain-containing protein YvlB